MIGSAAIGAGGAYLSMGALFMVVLFTVSRLPATQAKPRAQRRAVKTELADGVRYVARDPALRTLMLLFLAGGGPRIHVADRASGAARASSGPSADRRRPDVHGECDFRPRRRCAVGEHRRQPLGVAGRVHVRCVARRRLPRALRRADIRNCTTRDAGFGPGSIRIHARQQRADHGEHRSWLLRPG